MHTFFLFSFVVALAFCQQPQGFDQLPRALSNINANVTGIFIWHGHPYNITNGAIKYQRNTTGSTYHDIIQLGNNITNITFQRFSFLSSNQVNLLKYPQQVTFAGHIGELLVDWVCLCEVWYAREWMFQLDPAGPAHLCLLLPDALQYDL
eukprot:TRINITY_DN18269_c0_g1_i1.p1 TRINITY_DN18269_c0_g1~~TRINITY_DN18269_c0_g1_i1.p1  ORF type:complete len:150 (+),score=17.38 TRINITY_DN18269_c0_g1_i1:195-644(+)